MKYEIEKISKTDTKAKIQKNSKNNRVMLNKSGKSMEKKGGLLLMYISCS